MLSVLLSSLMLGLLSADNEQPKSEPPPASASTAKKRVIRLETITVEGRIQKPQAFYILQRSNLNFDDLRNADSFLPKVSKSVEKEPF